MNEMREREREKGKRERERELMECQSTVCGRRWISRCEAATGERDDELDNEVVVW